MITTSKDTSELLSTLLYGVYVTRTAKINHVIIKITNYLYLHCQLTNYSYVLTQQNLYIIAEVNKLSSAIYRNGILHSKLKTLAKV